MCPAPVGVMRARCAGLPHGTDLGEGYEVVAEGLSGRTTVFSDYIEPYRAGIEQIVPIVQSHAPDALVVMLGTNDTKTRYHVCAQEIGLRHGGASASPSHSIPLFTCAESGAGIARAAALQRGH